MNAELAKYEKLWGNHASYRTVAPGEHLVDMFLKMATVQAHNTVIDFGCGTGRGALRIAEKTGSNVTAIDFADNCLDPEVRMAVTAGILDFKVADLTQPLNLGQVADYGYCTDVMEHIPPEDVTKVLTNILASARRVYFCISTVEDRMGALIGEPLHLTVQPAQWWRDKLEKDFECKIMHCQDLGNAVAIYCTAWATVDEFEHKTTLNVELQRVKDNIYANLDMGLQEIRPYDAQDTEVIFLAGGPSLNDFVDEIHQKHRVEGMPLITVNGAYNWAIEKGFKPGLQAIVDARGFNKRFLEPLIDSCKYAISSQCDPELAKSLPRDQVFLWHVGSEEVKGFIEDYSKDRQKDHEYYPVAGGSTVSMCTLVMLAMLGFRKINVYGLDSCIRKDQHHAYNQPENDGESVVPISVNGKEFLCTGWMIRQSQVFMEVVKHILGPADVELAVHGDGLIAAIIDAASAAVQE